MIGFTKCKDLEDWLMGSGESAETADSKAQQANQPTGQQVARQKATQEQAEWMFKTFDNPCKPEADPSLDPFAARDSASDSSSDDDMLGGGLHLMAGARQPDFVGHVAEKCTDLNQFILKMDQLVRNAHN